MAKKKVGELIKEARTNAGLTQENLAKKIKGLTAADISLAERGEKDLTVEDLKAIAKVTGVTQKSLLDARTTTAQKKTGTAGRKTSSTSSSVKRLSAAEEKLVELYRKADSETKKAAVALLKDGKSKAGDILGSLLGKGSVIDAVSGLFGKDKK